MKIICIWLYLRQYLTFQQWNSDCFYFKFVFGWFNVNCHLNFVRNDWFLVETTVSQTSPTTDGNGITTLYNEAISQKTQLWITSQTATPSTSIRPDTSKTESLNQSSALSNQQTTTSAPSLKTLPLQSGLAPMIFPTAAVVIVVAIAVLITGVILYKRYKEFDILICFSTTFMLCRGFYHRTESDLFLVFSFSSLSW